MKKIIIHNGSAIEAKNFTVNCYIPKDQTSFLIIEFHEIHKSFSHILPDGIPPRFCDRITRFARDMILDFLKDKDKDTLDFSWLANDIPPEVEKWQKAEKI